MNDAGVSVSTFADGKPAFVMLKPPPAGSRFNQETALRVAAWLVALADGPALDAAGRPLTGPHFDRLTRFDQVLEAVKNT